MPRRALNQLLTGLAVVALLASAPARADRPHGMSAGATRSAEHFRFPGDWQHVLKVPRPAEWRDGKLFLVAHADRVSYAKASQHASTVLRSDEAFLARFGRIVPKVGIEHDSWISQGARGGASLRELSGEREETARHEMARAVEMATRLVGAVDADPAHFTFEYSTGKIKGWLAAPPQPEGVATEFSLVKPLGEGANARAYEVRSSDPRSSRMQVIKVLKPYAPRRAPEEAPLPVLDALSREAEFLSHALSSDAAFAERFGDIIPKTQALAPGVIAQELAEGRTFDSLDSDAQQKARGEIADLRKMVDRIAKGVIVTGRTKNYLFRKNGRIASLYDIASDGHKAYEKAGLKERFFAHRVAAATAEPPP